MIDSPANTPRSIPSDPGGDARQEKPNLPGCTPSYINPCSRYDVGSINPQPFDGPADHVFTPITNPTVQGEQGVKIDGFMNEAVKR